MGYNELDNTTTIIPHVFPLDVKFNISSAKIQLIYLKGVFVELPTNDADI